MMITGGKQRKSLSGKHAVNRVSSAIWPAPARRGVATGKAAQRRRDWIMQGRWWVVLFDALSMRALLIVATLLVVVSSLVVAALGLNYWYLLLLPLLLFICMLIAPSFLASRGLGEIPSSAFSAFTQEFKSSAGYLSVYAQELKSNSGLLSAESTPETPVPDSSPLVRILETVDLSRTPLQPFLLKTPSEMTQSEQATVPSCGEIPTSDYWEYARHAREGEVF